jgi:hypothetical protein
MFSDFHGMSFLLEDWFEGYHEFHISKNQDGNHRLKLWDFHYGYKYLSPEQSFDIYRQASKILTLYYDIDDFSEIFPWHHAAGDFVVKVTEETIDVRLTTARRYEPFIGFAGQNALNPLLSLCYYLMNLTIRMRLDKLDGLGEVIWMNNRCVEATVKGFFEALTLKRDIANSIGDAEGFLALLQSFSVSDLRTLVNPLLEQYRGTGDFSVVISNSEKHIEELYAILQNLPL